MSNKFIARIAGAFQQVTALAASAGAQDANKIVATSADGRLDASLMPVGFGAKTTAVPASEQLGAGAFVNLFDDGGTLKARLADNSNARAADGFVLSATAPAAVAQVYPLDDVNAQLSGLTVGADYWLGTAGGVLAVPLDAGSSANAGKLCQYLGKAKSATELLTCDAARVTL